MRIGVFTGSRANYSSTKTIIQNMSKDPDIQLISIVGGAATLSRYGALDKKMVEEGLPKPDFIFNMFIDGERLSDMAKSCGIGIMEMSSALNNLSLDALLVVGDRYDVMAPVIAASFMNIPIIHTMGGEVTGTIDESIRHAITKFSHIHFVANNDARERVIKLGENPQHVHNVGCPRLDLVKQAIEKECLTNLSFHERYSGVGERQNIEKDFILASFHPVTSELEDMRRQVDELLKALNEIKMPTILLWPNFDAGSSQVAKSIRTFREKKKADWLSVYNNFSVEDYSILMNRTSCLVGNSSSGIREGAFIGTPVVNIGTRQNSRIHGNNVIQVNCEADAISKAIKMQLKHGKFDKEYIYGDGSAGEKILNILKSKPMPAPQKKIMY
jgi:UDP-hydrolysing UDP-N-acetyl-D-glucosamine 2-epimerase